MDSTDANSLFAFAERPRKSGLGAVARAPIEAGTVVCVDRPVIVLEGEENGLVEDVDSVATNKIYYKRGPPAIRKKFEELPEADQRQAAALSDCHAEEDRSNPHGSDAQRRKLLLIITQKKLGMSEDDVEELYTTKEQLGVLPPGTKSIFGIFRTNCIPQGEENAQGLYPLISRFNHSCVPNAIYTWRPALGTNVVVATRDIAEGEEICVSYFKSHHMTREERRKRTMFTWGFNCECQACKPVPDHMNEEFEAMQAHIRQVVLRNPSLTDDVVLRMIPQELQKFVYQPLESDDRRERMWHLNQQMELATNLQHGLMMHSEMRKLFEEEKLIPGLVFENLLCEDLLNLHAVYGTNITEARRVTRELCRLEELLRGKEGNENLAKFVRWRDSERGAPTAVDFMVDHQRAAEYFESINGTVERTAMNFR